MKISVKGSLGQTLGAFAGTFQGGKSYYGVIEMGSGLDFYMAAKDYTAFVKGPSIAIPEAGPSFMTGTITQFELKDYVVEEGEGMEFVTLLNVSGLFSSASNLFDLVRREGTSTFYTLDDAVFREQFQGDWEIAGSAGADLIAPGPWMALGGSNVIAAGGGNDFVDACNGRDSVLGGWGADLLLGGAADDRLDGGDGRDTLRGGSGNDILGGGAGADSLYGEAGKDILTGGLSNDTLRGGEGDDTLTGGSGADLFVFTRFGGNDTVTDFDPLRDRIDLPSTGGHEVRDVAAGVRILVEGGSILLLGVEPGDLTADILV
jgi:hypothetical protein